MANEFSAKPVPGSVQGELDARANVTALNEWFATRTNWAHIESYCSECSSNVGTLTGLKYAIPYEGAYDGSRPRPVIDSIQVKAQGNLGTTRACTIKIIAFTQEQVNELAACYGVPMMSVRVQFGWNKGAVGGSGSPAPLTGPLADTKAVCAINNRRNSYAVYDGLQGQVGQWSVSFVKENMWWEFTIDLVAASSPVLSRPLEDFTAQCYCDRTSQDPQTQETVTESRGTSPFRAKIIDYITKAASLTSTVGRQEEGIYIIHLNHANRDELGGSPSSNMLMSLISGIAKMAGNTEECNEAYISFGKLEDLVNNYSFSQTGNGPLMAKFDSSKLGKISFKAPGFSSDPDICLFPGLDRKYFDGLDGVQNAPSCKDGDGINIQNVLLNCIFVNQCIENSGKDATLQDFFEKIFTGMNQAAAGMFELSIIDDGACDDGGGQVPTLSAIDLQKIKALNSGYVLPVGPTKAVIRDLKLGLKLPDAMKSQALYGGVRTNSNSRPCDEARFKKELTGPINKTLPVQKAQPPKSDCPEDCKTEEEHNAEKPTVSDDYDEMIDDTTAAAKETVRGRLVEEYNKGAESDLCKNMIVPYEFSFTVDGIGGFAFGQYVDCTLLPSNVRQKYVYQVTSVEQSVTYGDWTTTVNTVARYR